MRTNSTATAAIRQSTGSDPIALARSATVDQQFALLRKCIAECGYTIDALAAHMRIDRGYLWKLLNREKTEWKPEHTVALPDDVEALYYQRLAEGFGRIVVEPVEGDAAIRNLVSGLFGVLRPRVLDVPRRMAKASLEDRR